MNKQIKPGDSLIVMNDKPLKGNDVGPEIKSGDVHTCRSVHMDSKGNPHIDIGLPLKVNYVTSYETGEELPKTTHWCHPSRFVIE